MVTDRVTTQMVTDRVAALSDEDQDQINCLKREIRLLRSDLIDIKNEKSKSPTQQQTPSGTQRLNFKE